MAIDITTIEKDNTLARSRVVINENFEALQNAVQTLQENISNNKINCTDLTVSNSIETKNFTSKNFKTDYITSNTIKETASELNLKSNINIEKNISINGIIYNNIFSVHNADSKYQMSSDIVNNIRVIKPSNGSYQYYDFSNYVENDDHINKISVSIDNVKVGQKLVLYLNPIPLEESVSLSLLYGNTIEYNGDISVLTINTPTVLEMTYIGPKWWITKM